MKKKNYFTLVELLIAIAVSSIIVAMVLTVIMQVAYVTRDMVTDYSLTTQGRLVRYQLMRGNSSMPGLSSGKDLQVSNGSIKYKAYKPGVAYAFSRGENYSVCDIDLSDRLKVSNEVYEEELFLPTVIIDESLTKAAKLEYKKDEGKDLKDIHNSFVRLWIKRDYQGKRYVIEQVIKTVSYDGHDAN